jgi:hypothetical protein
MYIYIYTHILYHMYTNLQSDNEIPQLFDKYIHMYIFICIQIYIFICVYMYVYINTYMSRYIYHIYIYIIYIYIFITLGASGGVLSGRMSTDMKKYIYYIICISYICIYI